MDVQPRHELKHEISHGDYQALWRRIAAVAVEICSRRQTAQPHRNRPVSSPQTASVRAKNPIKQRKQAHKRLLFCVLRQRAVPNPGLPFSGLWKRSIMNLRLAAHR